MRKPGFGTAWPEYEYVSRRPVCSGGPICTRPLNADIADGQVDVDTDSPAAEKWQKSVGQAFGSSLSGSAPMIVIGNGPSWPFADPWVNVNCTEEKCVPAASAAIRASSDDFVELAGDVTSHLTTCVEEVVRLNGAPGGSPSVAEPARHPR